MLKSRWYNHYTGLWRFSSRHASDVSPINTENKSTQTIANIQPHGANYFDKLSRDGWYEQKEQGNENITVRIYSGGKFFSDNFKISQNLKYYKYYIYLI